MLNTVKGVYDNGQLVLEEVPETTGPVEVLVTFTGVVAADKPKQHNKRTFGIGKGTVLYMAPDFNEPLEELKDYM